MAKEECPDCGEPIEEDASFCPHCGSDEETGWKPDADYYSVELPEDDEDFEDDPSEVESHRPPEADLVGPGLVVGAWAFFAVLGYRHYQAEGSPVLVVFPALYLAVTMALVFRVAHHRTGSRAA